MLNRTHSIIAYSTLQERRAISYLLIDYFMRLLIALLPNLIIFSTYLYVVLAYVYLYVYAPTWSCTSPPLCTVCSVFPLTQLDPETPRTLSCRVSPEGIATLTCHLGLRSRAADDLIASLCQQSTVGEFPDTPVTFMSLFSWHGGHALRGRSPAKRRPRLSRRLVHHLCVPRSFKVRD